MIDILWYGLLGAIMPCLISTKYKKSSYSIICLYWFLLLLWSINSEALISFHPFTWSQTLNIQWQYHTDGLAKLFSLLISAISIAIFGYLPVYTHNMKPDEQKRLTILMQWFGLSMMLLVLTDNLIVLFLAWELTTVLSYLLIQFHYRDAQANQNALNAMLISVIGALLMLVGFLLLYQQTQSWSIAANLTWLKSAPAPLLVWPFVLLLIGAMGKSAQFPFHFWLPGAMKAPTPVSAYLHSATMVNAGIYLLARFHPGFAHTAYWYTTLATIGLVTMLLSAILSWLQHDLKAILAYTTLFALGLMFYLLASNQALTLEALVLFLLFHGVYKAAAFILVGTIDKEYGTRDYPQLLGILRKRPGLLIFSCIIFLSMAGLPPLFGFTMKEMLYEVKIASGSISYVMLICSMVGSILIAGISLFLLLNLIFKRPNNVIDYKPLYPSIVTLLGLCLVILLGNLLIHDGRTFLAAAVNSIGTQSNMQLLSPTTWSSSLLSLLTVTSGGLLAAITYRLNYRLHYSKRWFQHGFEKRLAQLITLGQSITKQTADQPVQTHLALLLGTLVIVVASAMWPIQFVAMTQITAEHGSVIYQLLVTLIFIVILASILALMARWRFMSNMLSLAVIGLFTSLFFIMQGAADVAMTQLLVEILTVVVFVIVLRHDELHYHPQPGHLLRKTAALLIAVLLGLLILDLLAGVLQSTPSKALQHFYFNHSVMAAYGRNVVNVILVDFRAFDTLGEVLVVFAVALSIIATFQATIQQRRTG